MTPGQFYAYASGYMDRLKDEQEMKKAEIYNLSGLIRMAVWSKRMPTFESVFGERKSRGKMSDEEMYAVVAAMNAAMGGKKK